MELNPFSYEFHENPYPTYKWLRQNSPLYRNDKLDFWALTRFRDVIGASHDWATYSSAEGITLERMDPRTFDLTPMMIFMDPPRHDRLRKLVGHAFTPRRINDLEPFIRQISARLIEPLAKQGGGDFVQDFSTPLPMEVIFTMLGVPDADRQELRHWMDKSLDRDDDSPQIPARAIEASMNLVRYWFQLVPDLRQHPNDGLICSLLEAEITADDGSAAKLTDGEIAGFCALIGAAGNETVTKALANAAVLFARHPGEWNRVVDTPALIPGAMEESLRYYPPSQYQGRTLTRDVEWYGAVVPKGARILLVTGSATRDEEEFKDPERFDIERPVPIAMSFGYGIHFCLGASLARLESRVAMEEFAKRFPKFRIDESRARRVHMSNVHGFESVPFEA